MRFKTSKLKNGVGDAMFKPNSPSLLRFSFQVYACRCEKMVSTVQRGDNNTATSVLFQNQLMRMQNQLNNCVLPQILIRSNSKTRCDCDSCTAADSSLTYIKNASYPCTAAIDGTSPFSFSLSRFSSDLWLILERGS